MSEGKTNRIASRTAKSLKKLLGGWAVGEEKSAPRGGVLLTAGRREDHSPGTETQERAGGPAEEAKPQSSALPASLTPQNPPWLAFPAVHSTQKPHGAGLFTARSAWRGLQKDYLRKKWAQFVLTPLLVSDCCQQPKAGEHKLAASSPGCKACSPTPFDLPLSQAMPVFQAPPRLQEPRGRLGLWSQGAVLHSSFWGRDPVRGRYWKKD